jgi:hypothetical protein
MAAINLHYPKMKVFQLLSTQVAAGAKIYTYEAGTSTDKATYSDQGLTTANANPVICDSNGEANVWLLDDGLYKIIINDSDGELISSEDNQGSVLSTTTVEGAYNLVPNGSFETNSGDNGTPTGWTLNITTTATIQIDKSDTFHGDSCLEFIGGASGAGTATSGYFEVQSSKDIGVRFSLKASAATVDQTVKILWYTDDAGTAASTASTTVYNVTTTAPTSWTEQILTATAGSDALFAKVEISGSVEEVGPTGSTNEWTVLDSLATDVDWIRVRIWLEASDTGSTSGASRTATLYARDGGSSAAVSNDTIIARCSYLNNTNGGGSNNSFTEITLPVTLNKFEIRWNSSAVSSTTIEFRLVGYGYNAV